MGVIRFLRLHVDSVVAIALAATYLVEVYLAEAPVVGEPIIDGVEIEEVVVMATTTVFLFSLAMRTQLPLVPFGLGAAALALSGRAQADPLYAVLLGLALAAYSVGAWAGGRAGQVGALGVGALVGLIILRSWDGSLDADAHGAPAILLLGAWLAGLAVRSIRAARGDPRISGEIDWGAGVAAPDSAGRDDIVRDLRDVLERSMSAVILQARNARRSLDDDPAAAQRSLAVIEAAASEALEETQRLTGLLLSPDGAPLPEPQPGLADLDFLTEQVIAAGLPVDTRIEGRPLPLTPDLDAVAYRVVHEALMATLNHATSATSSVVIRYEADELQVEVSDDGLALDDDDAAAQTAGLMEVRGEVVALGGTLDAAPGEERGYWVLARLPYEPDWG